MREKVIEIFAKVAKVDEREVSESTPLRDSVFKNNANALSLDFINETIALLCLERAFDIKLPDDFLDDTNTVGDVIDKLKKTIQR